MRMRESRTLFNRSSQQSDSLPSLTEVRRTRNSVMTVFDLVTYCSDRNQVIGRLKSHDFSSGAPGLKDDV